MDPKVSTTPWCNGLVSSSEAESMPGTAAASSHVAAVNEVQSYLDCDGWVERPSVRPVRQKPRHQSGAAGLSVGMSMKREEVDDENPAYQL